MKFKTQKEDVDLDLVLAEKPALLAVLAWMDEYARRKFGKEITITSVYRSDGTLHSELRATDVRIGHPDRPERQPQITYEEACELLDKTNRLFTYGNTYNGRPSQTVHLVHDPERPLNTHLHVQIHGECRAWTHPGALA